VRRRRAARPRTRRQTPPAPPPTPEPAPVEEALPPLPQPEPIRRRPPPAPPSGPAPAAPSVGAEPAVRSQGAGALVHEVLWATGLSNVLVLAGRELRVLLLSPIAWLAGAAALVVTSLFGFLPPLVAGDPAAMTGAFDWLALSMAVATPLLAMGLLAREESSGTMDLLLSSPVRLWELVAGKWLGGLVFFVAVVALTLVDVVLVSVAEPQHAPARILGLRVSLPALDYGVMVAGYLGTALVGAAWVALALLASSVTRHQVLAAAIGIAVLLGLQYGLDAIAPNFGSPLSAVLQYAGAAGHARTFARGQVALRDVVYFLTLTAGALFLATRVIEARWWRR
jgi:ABC-2 type transport system permease protein